LRSLAPEFFDFFNLFDLITVGVFDSGVGGLSVLRALRTELPQVHFVYLADNAHAPYGERAAEVVVARAQRITEQLRTEHHIQALVVACNTATALAIDDLRQTHPDLPFIGVEPALKPAAILSRNGHIGVLATRGTLQSARFALLLGAVTAAADRPLHVRCQPCDGLADAIERADAQAVLERATHHLAQLRRQDLNRPAIDTLVLGCTHYPFARETLQSLCGAGVLLVDTSEAVAWRTRAVLNLTAVLSGTSSTSVTLLSTGDKNSLNRAGIRWLGQGASDRVFAS
jgi:glutamate racemase